MRGTNNPIVCCAAAPICEKIEKPVVVVGDSTPQPKSLRCVKVCQVMLAWSPSFCALRIG